MTTVTYDEVLLAMRIQFSDAEVAGTVELSTIEYMDVDADAQPVGMERFNADPPFAELLLSDPGAVDLGDLLRSGAG